MMTITLGNVRAVARFAACAVLLCATGALAQQAAEPAQELPPLEVTAKKSAQKKAAAKKAQAKAAPKAAPQPAAPEPQSEQPAGVTNGLPPVEGYVATEATTGTKTDTPLRETPQSISVVGKEQMRDQGVQSIQEAVRYVPGVLADGFGVDSRNDFSVIRGTAAAYYIDGLRKTYGYWANTATIEPYALERVEVLRGPASMIYGQTPAGGLINGISKLPLDTPYTEIGVDYGSFDFKQVRFDSTGTVTTDGKWLYRITGLARDADTQVDSVENDRYMIQPSITYRPTNDTSITFLGNLRKDDTGSTQQFLPAVGTLTPVPGFGRVPRDAFMGNPDDYHRVEEQSATLLVDHKFSSALSLHHGMRYTHNEVDFDTNYPLIITQPRVDTFNALLGFPIFNADNAPFLGSNLSPGFLGPILPRVRTVERNDTEVFNTDTYLTARFDTGPVQHKLMGGVDYMRYSTDRASANLIDNLVLDPALADGICAIAFGGVCPSPGLIPPQSPFNIFDPNGSVPPYYIDLNGGIVFGDIPFRTQSQTQTQTGLYLQDQVKIGPWIGLLGVRQDWLEIDASNESLSEQATTWRGALMYETPFGLNPYVSYGESFTPQVGSYVGETLLTPFEDRTPAGPIEGEQIEIGVKYQPVGSWFAVNAAVFDLKQSNIVASADPQVFAELAGAATHVRGFELEVVGQLTPELRVVGGYTYMDAKWDKYPDPLGATEGTQLHGAPEHMASLWGIYTLHDGPLKGLSVGAGVRYVGSITDTGPILSIDYSTQTITQLGVNSVTAPAYTLFDAMVAYETEDWRWQLTAQNLEDEYYVTTCYAFRGDCGIGQGRTLITSFTYNF